jgi:hypothetical protein
MKVETRPGLQGFTGLYGALVFLVRFAGAAGKPFPFLLGEFWPSIKTEPKVAFGSWLCENSKAFSKVPQNAEILRSLIELS